MQQISLVVKYWSNFYSDNVLLHILEELILEECQCCFWLLKMSVMCKSCRLPCSHNSCCVTVCICCPGEQALVAATSPRPSLGCREAEPGCSLAPEPGAGGGGGSCPGARPCWGSSTCTGAGGSRGLGHWDLLCLEPALGSVLQVCWAEPPLSQSKQWQFPQKIFLSVLYFPSDFLNIY